MSASVTATGGPALAALADRLTAAGVAVADLASANEQAGREVIDAAHPPRRSGALAASLRAVTSPTRVDFTGTVRYWTFVHWGAPRRHVRARPFFSEAIAADTAAILAVYTDHTDRALRKV